MKGLRIRGLRGVTLIELCIVMAIIAIMGLFMAPAIGEWVENYRIRQATRDIVSTLQLAKMQAISTRTSHSVTFTPAAGTYQITPGGSATQVQRGVSIDRTDFTVPSNNVIRFNPNGTTSSTSSNDSIYINNTNGKQYRVRVSPSGNISMKEGWT